MTTSPPKQQEKAVTINSTSPRELIDTELDAVCGGVPDLGKSITKAVDDAISAAAGPPNVWVGCAWVPQWW